MEEHSSTPILLVAANCWSSDLKKAQSTRETYLAIWTFFWIFKTWRLNHWSFSKMESSDAIIRVYLLYELSSNTDRYSSSLLSFFCVFLLSRHHYKGLIKVWHKICYTKSWSPFTLFNSFVAARKSSIHEDWGRWSSELQFNWCKLKQSIFCSCLSICYHHFIARLAPWLQLSFNSKTCQQFFSLLIYVSAQHCDVPLI